MIIKKRVQGHDITLEYVVLKKYPRFTTFNVYRLFKTTKKLLYTTCLTRLQIQDIKRAGYVINDEEVEINVRN